MHERQSKLTWRLLMVKKIVGYPNIISFTDVTKQILVMTQTINELVDKVNELESKVLVNNKQQ